MSRMVCSPGVTSRIFGSELTTIDAVATSPWTPPAIFERIGGQPEDLDRVVRFRRAEVRLHVQRDDRLAVPVTDAVLDDAADVSRIDREKLARDRPRRHLRLNLVGDPIQLPAHRVGNHRHRLGQPDMADAAVVDLLLKLLARQTGADLLLERQATHARILDAIHADRIHALADAGQRDRQRIHDESRVDAGTEHGHAGLLRQLMHRTRVAHVRLRRIRQLLCRRHDGHLELEDRFDLRQHLLQRRAGAQHGHVGLAGLDGLLDVVDDLHLQRAADTRHLAEISANLGRIDIDRADDLESFSPGDLSDDGCADRPEAEVQDPDRSRLCCHYGCSPEE